MKREVICFDIDGTLMKTNKAHIEAFNRAFEKNNLGTVSSARISAQLGKTGIEIIHNLFPSVSLRKVEAIAEDHSNFLKETMIYAQEIPGVNDALLRLKKHYKLAVISNATHKDILLMMEQGGIDNPRIFDAIIGKDDVKNAKPSGEEIKKIEKILGCRAAYVVGDTIYDIRAGKDAGAKTVAVLTGVGTIEELGKEKPTMIIQSVAILPDVLLGTF